MPAPVAEAPGESQGAAAHTFPHGPDRTYDGIDLLSDASWVWELARAISAVTHLLVELDDGP